MTQANHAKATRRTHRAVPGLITATAVMVVQLWSATPAHADHRVMITHFPPPVAIAGSDVRLLIAVDGCWIFCTPIELKTTYWAEKGRKRTVTKRLGSFPPEIAVITIPGGYVAKPILSYSIKASQDYCGIGDPCHGTEERLPESGSYSVRVE